MPSVMTGRDEYADVNGSALAVKASRAQSSPIGGELSQLQAAAAVLREQVTELADRLAPVRVTHPAAIKGEGADRAAPQPSLCSLAEEVQGVRESLAVTSNIVSVVMNTLQL